MMKLEHQFAAGISSRHQTTMFGNQHISTTYLSHRVKNARMLNQILTIQRLPMPGLLLDLQQRNGNRYVQRILNASHVSESMPPNLISRSPDNGQTISPTDPTLRRVNPVDPVALSGAMRDVQSGSYAPVQILETNLGPGTVRIVVDGVHRVQAAINLGIDRIRYEPANEAALRRVAEQRGVNFDEMLQRAQRFDVSSWPGGGSQLGGVSRGPTTVTPGGSQLRTGIRSRGRAALRGGGAALIGQLLGDAIQLIGDIAIQRRIRRELQQRQPAITQYLSANPSQGVLVIVMLQEWATPDPMGRRARAFLALTTSFGGRTKAEALVRWHSTPMYLLDAPSGWRVHTEYFWIPPSQP